MQKTSEDALKVFMYQNYYMKSSEWICIVGQLIITMIRAHREAHGRRCVSL